MSVPTVSWDETSPAGSDNVSAGDNRIREMKTQIREVIDVDHDFPSSGQAADNGQHKKVTLQEQADIGTGAEGVPILGGQTVNGKAELMFTDEDDNDIQLTSAGKLDLGSGRLDNNENLTGRNNAGSADVNIIKVNTSDQAEVSTALLTDGGVILPEITAPTTAANQGAVYTKNDGTQTELYFVEESDGDEVQLTKGGNVNTTSFLGNLVKGWVVFDGTTNTAGKCTISASENVTDVDDNGTGDYTINWDTNFGSANYVVVGTSNNGSIVTVKNSSPSIAAGSVTMRCLNSAFTAVDRSYISVMAIGTQ